MRLPVPSARALRLCLSIMLWGASATAQPDHDACSEAHDISTAAYTDMATTVGATTDANDPIPSCGNQSRANSVWYRFTRSRCRHDDGEHVRQRLRHDSVRVRRAV
jgi:hypothetical protein